jgi:hypothetical protein
MNYQKAQTKNDLEKEFMKFWKKIDLDYRRQVIGAILGRVYSVEKNNGQLIINKHSLCS